MECLQIDTRPTLKCRQVLTLTDADATDRSELVEYKDEVTKVTASKTCRLRMQMLTVKLFDFRVVNAVSV
jgi:hypothetical protein